MKASELNVGDVFRCVRGLPGATYKVEEHDGACDPDYVPVLVLSSTHVRQPVGTHLSVPGDATVEKCPIVG